LKLNKKRIKKILKIFLYFFIGFSILILLIPLPSPLFNNDYSVVVLDKNNEILRAFLNKEDQWRFKEFKNFDIPYKLKQSIIYFEDRYFYKHIGFNPVSLVRAFFQNITKGRVVSGASTITMQVVRLSTKNKRNIFNKLIEILQAIKLEIKYSKDEILKFYVNNAPYGGNIIGYTAASLKYFNKLPEKLSWAQAATLAVLPNSPSLVSPNKFKNILKKKRNKLLKKLYKNNVINKQTYDFSIMEPIVNRNVNFFKIAPHFSRFVKNKIKNKFIIKTTIDSRLQKTTESLLEKYIEYLNSFGVNNGAVLVAEVNSGKIRAYVGSQKFFGKKGSQVDGVQSPRSSGSILKPFLYALSIDKGLILPQTMLKDIPTYFGTFSPSNSNREYKGLVSAHDALRDSLNVPAVRLLNYTGLESFYGFLKNAGITTLFRTPTQYGLTLILGGAEVKLFDMVKLFRGLANRGYFMDLKFLKQNDTRSNYNKLLSPEACYMVLNILKDLRRPGAEYYWQQYDNKRPIAWKTGTSYGQRDAWAIGVNPDWVVGIWIGNFNGESNEKIMGAAVAGPLLFKIFEVLPQLSENKWFLKRGLRFKTIELCKDTGYRASEFCTHKLRALIPYSSPIIKECPYHKRYFVTNDERYSVCSLCWKQGDYKAKSYLVYPPDVTQFLRERGVIVSKVPPHNPKCELYSEKDTIQIIYPENNSKIFIPRDIGGKIQRLIIKVAHRISNSRVFWYLDKEYMGYTDSVHKRDFVLNTGWHRLYVVDEFGNSKSIRFFVYTKK